MLIGLLLIVWVLAFVVARWAYARRWLTQDWHRDIAALGLLALVTAAFFWRLLLTPGAWMPEGGGDMAPFLLPMYHFAARSLRHGQIPLWNPYLYSGAPFAADIQAGLFYPINLALFLLVPEITYGWLEFLSAFHFFVAGAGMYFCLRYLRSGPAALSRPAALAGAVAFMFSDLFVTHFGNLNLIAVAAWLPGVFLCYHRALRSLDVRTAVGWGLAGGILLSVAILAGHIQPFLFILMVLGLYLLYHILCTRTGRKAGLSPAPSVVTSGRHVQTKRSELARYGTEAILHRMMGSGQHLRAIGIWLGLSALTVGVGLGLAAVVLLPAHEMAGYTRRAALSYAEATQYSLPPSLLVGLLAPGVFGRGMQRYWGPWPRVETGYLGVIPLILAVTAVALRRANGRQIRSAPVGFFAGLAVIAFALALGRNTPAYEVVHRFVPGFGGLRAPARFVYLMDFALAALAGLGFDALLRARPDAALRCLKRTCLPAGLGALLLVVPGTLTAYRLLQVPDTGHPFRSSQAAVALGFLVLMVGAGVVLLMAYGRGWLGGRGLSVVALALIVLDLLLTGSSLDWISWDPTANLRPAALAFFRSDPSLYRIEVRPESWGWWSPDTALMHGLFDVGGIYNPLQLADYQLYWESLTDRAMPLYDFLNAKYVIAPKDFALPWGKFVPVYDRDPLVNVYLNQGALPRVLMVYRSRVARDHLAAWEAIHAPGFDPSAEVVVEGGRPLAGPPAEPPQLSITSYSLNEIGLDVATSDEGYLVLSEVYYPGWRAYLDGQEVELLRANYAFRAVLVSPRSHHVRFVFAPASWRWGVLVSGFSLVVAVGLAGWVVWGSSSRRAGGGPFGRLKTGPIHAHQPEGL